MRCQNCKHFIFGDCVITDKPVMPDSLCNAWELSLSWGEVVEMQPATDRTAELQARIAKLEWFINKFIGEGTYLNMLNGLTQGDSYWERIVNEYKTWREELVR